MNAVTPSDAPTSPEPKPGILDIAAYVPGQSKADGFKQPRKLSSNENPLGPSPKAVEAYRRVACDLHRYPDGSHVRLRAAIGARHRLDPERIVCGAGSDELIQLLVKSYAGIGDRVIHSAHGFLVYPIAAKAAGAEPVAAPEADLVTDVDAILSRVDQRTRIVLIANPNNPTGTMLPASEIRRLHAGLPGQVLLVLDAAYAEYVERDDYEAGAALVEAASNVVMLRTFSKIHGLAALRLGWAYCPPAIVDVLNRVRGPFNVSSPALEAGIAALEDHAHEEAARAINRRGLAYLPPVLTQLGLTVMPSVANFVLIRFPQDAGRNADAAFAFLVERGIILRKMGAYGLGDCLRLSIGTDEDQRAVTEALTEFLAS